MHRGYEKLLEGVRQDKEYIQLWNLIPALFQEAISGLILSPEKGFVLPESVQQRKTTSCLVINDGFEASGNEIFSKFRQLQFEEFSTLFDTFKINEHRIPVPGFLKTHKVFIRYKQKGLSFKYLFDPRPKANSFFPFVQAQFTISHDGSKNSIPTFNPYLTNADTAKVIKCIRKSFQRLNNITPPEEKNPSTVAMQKRRRDKKKKGIENLKRRIRRRKTCLTEDEKERLIALIKHGVHMDTISIENKETTIKIPINEMEEEIIANYVDVINRLHTKGILEATDMNGFVEIHFSY